MLYGRTPFRGKNRQKTFSNILYKDLTFPSSIPVNKNSFPDISCSKLLDVVCHLLQFFKNFWSFVNWYNFTNFQVSLAARQLINALLQRDPASRLGSTTGANEIKQHPFFREINWPLIRNMVLFLWFLLNLSSTKYKHLH